jgi:hypothetical protein
MSETKTIEEKKLQIKSLLNQINEFEINISMFPEIKIFHQIIKKYIYENIPSSGKIHLDVINRDLVYILPNAKHIICSVNLKYCKDKTNIK